MISRPLRFFIMAGEVSGDLLGAKLIDHLQALHPQAEFFGVGGEAMRQRALHLEMPMEDFRVMGFSAVLSSLPRLSRQFFQLRDRILATQPDLVCLIDYVEFNIRLARSLRRKGYKGKIVQYVCPTVWAWGKYRIRMMEPHLDLILSIYPFEPALLRNTRLNIQYIGNPLAASLWKHQYESSWIEPYKLRPEVPVLSIFPGSRPSEIRLNFGKQLRAARMLLQESPECDLAISVAHPGLQEGILHELQAQSITNAKLIANTHRYELMQKSHASLATMGSVTMELALHRVPTVVSYQMKTLDRLIAEYLLRINLDFYCMANIIRGEEVFPELLAYHATPERQLEALKPLFRPGPQRERCLEQCNEVNQLLQNRDANESAAQAILELLHS